jgi:hypothetical protein
MTGRVRAAEEAGSRRTPSDPVGNYKYLPNYPPLGDKVSETTTCFICGKGVGSYAMTRRGDVCGDCAKDDRTVLRLATDCLRARPIGVAGVGCFAETLALNGAEARCWRDCPGFRDSTDADRAELAGLVKRRGAATVATWLKESE